jgi:riboflavin synthase alpha subunit
MTTTNAAQVPQQWMKYLLPKGFVAVDGCSLTVG